MADLSGTCWLNKDKQFIVLINMPKTCLMLRARESGDVSSNLCYAVKVKVLELDIF